MAAKFSVVELPADNFELWDGITAGSSQSTVFNTPAFSRAVETACGKPCRFLVCLRGDRPVAGLSFFEFSKKGVLMAGQPPLVPHLGLVLPRDVEEEHPRAKEFNVLEACKEFSRRLSVRLDYASFSHHPSLVDVRPFIWQGFTPRVAYTYRIDLAGFSMDALHSSVRKQVAKAEREKVEIAPSDDVTDLLRLVNQSFGKRGGKAPYSGTYLERLYKELDRQGLARLRYARDAAGRVTSGRISLESGDTVYDWVAGADPEFYETGATPYLLYSMIEESREGHRIFDLMGANTRSIAQFKSNFGGAITPYQETSRPFSLKGNLAVACLGLRRLWRKS